MSVGQGAASTAHPLDQVATLVIGYHEWPVPPNTDDLDLPVLRGIQQRLRGPMTAIVTGRVSRVQRFAIGPVRIVVVPASWRQPGFLLTAKREMQRWTGRARAPRTIVASEMWAGLACTIGSRRAPFLMQIQGEVLRPGPEYGGPTKRRAMGLVARRTVRRADLVRTPSAAVAAQVSSVPGAAPAVVVGTRVDTEAFAYREPRGEIPRSDGPRILCVGTLSALKNQTMLIRAVALLHQTWPGVRLEIVGSGPAKDEIRSLTRELGIDHVVRFAGRVPHASLPDMLADADLFAFPSLSEGQGRVVLEAQAAGVPVLASDLPAVREIVDQGQTGVLLPATDAAAWAKELGQLADDARLRMHMASTARAYVERHFAFDDQLDRFAEVVRDVAHG